MSVKDENEQPSRNPHESDSEGGVTAPDGDISPVPGKMNAARAVRGAHIEHTRREIVASSFSGPDSIKLDFQDVTFRTIGNRFNWRDSRSTYVAEIDFRLLHNLACAR